MSVKRFMDLADIQHAEVEKVIVLDDGRILLTAHFFFNDFDETPVAFLRDGAAFFFDSKAARRVGG